MLVIPGHLAPKMDGRKKTENGREDEPTWGGAAFSASCGRGAGALAREKAPKASACCLCSGDPINPTSNPRMPGSGSGELLLPQSVIDYGLVG